MSGPSKLRCCYESMCVKGIDQRPKALVNTVYYSSVAFIRVMKLICVNCCSEQVAQNYTKNFSEPQIGLYERNESDDRRRTNERQTETKAANSDWTDRPTDVENKVRETRTVAVNEMRRKREPPLLSGALPVVAAQWPGAVWRLTNTPGQPSPAHFSRWAPVIPYRKWLGGEGGSSMGSELSKLKLV